MAAKKAKKAAKKKVIRPKAKASAKKATPYTHYHKDGTIWAKGKLLNGVMTGYWEWFRKTGVRMRSGWFDDQGQQVGEWVTYDAKGKIYKVTTMKPKSKK
jgi:antitoxin component YwqK of YwqJK toxin-antitoxin module